MEDWVGKLVVANTYLTEKGVLFFLKLIFLLLFLTSWVISTIKCPLLSSIPLLNPHQPWTIILIVLIATTSFALVLYPTSCLQDDYFWRTPLYSNSDTCTNYTPSTWISRSSPSSPLHTITLPLSPLTFRPLLLQTSAKCFTITFRSSSNSPHK